MALNLAASNSPASNPFSLSGRRALVTGGTQGVGAAIAKSIAMAGGDVIIVGLRDDERAQETLQACRQTGVRAELLVADLAVPPDRFVDALVRDVDTLMHGIDVLVNNAGTFIDVPFLEMDFERYQTTMHLNLTAGYFLTQALARRWVRDHVAGRVLFTGSINGVLAEPDHTAYDASKGAVAALVRSLCVALAPHGIRVNSMAPGLVQTPLTRPAIDQGSVNAWMQLHTPNGRVPDADACGGAAVFLLSDAAEHVHGQTLLVDGGMSVWQQPDAPDNWPG
ncbi:Gluconate 5-dehydrogenase [Rubripirellula tenax]|uniref:Gluconate 5-dehydrogenase n=1 Tax=Rubripirellula tenax TaxID=2528015 RepID=A0A5C6FGV0_9BACT|nr:SDR family oxidoreductase [Rubripirellula tenax]TWU60731.1 Gluconate 5-dehydrogenase [Rubripirellula tenax]